MPTGFPQVVQDKLNDIRYKVSKIFDNICCKIKLNDIKKLARYRVTYDNICCRGHAAIREAWLVLFPLPRWDDRHMQDQNILDILNIWFTHDICDIIIILYLYQREGRLLCAEIVIESTISRVSSRRWEKIADCLKVEKQWENNEKRFKSKSWETMFLHNRSETEKHKSKIQVNEQTGFVCQFCSFFQVRRKIF